MEQVMSNLYIPRSAWFRRWDFSEVNDIHKPIFHNGTAYLRQHLDMGIPSIRDTISNGE